MSAEYVAGAFGLGGVILGAIIANGVEWLQKRKRHVAYWSAMSAEIDLCCEQAGVYLNDQVIAPLNRLPIVAYTNAFPGLLGDGAVSGGEAKAVLSFYNLVEQINRGIEQAHDALTPEGKKTDRSVSESMRVDVKCKRLVEKGGPYDIARAAIAVHAKLSDVPA